MATTSGRSRAIERVRPRLARAAPVGRRRADRQALGARRRPDRRRDRRAREPTLGRAPLRAADAGDGRRAPPAIRRRRAARRARPARRAGPADRPAPGRRPTGDCPSPSTARCRRRSSRRRWPTSSASTSSFRETTTICIERPIGTGAAVELIDTPPNPFLATVGLRVEPAAGRVAAIDVPARGRAGLDCRSRSSGRSRRPCARRCGRGCTAGRSPTARSPMTHSGLLAAAEPLPRDVRQEHVEHGRGLPQPHPAGADGRARAGRDTGVHEPIHRFRLEIPADTLGATAPVLARLRADPPDAGAARIDRPCWKATSRRRRCTSCNNGCRR